MKSMMHAAAIAAAQAALLGGCAMSPPTLLSGPDPSNPAASVARVRQAPVMTGGDVSFPVAPLAWEDVNRRVAPGAARAP